MPDMKEATHYAVSGIGYGKGFTPEEAVENYVRIQLANFPAKNTVYGTKAKFTKALKTGDLKPDVWTPPAGTVGFVIDHTGLNWVDEDENYSPAEDAQCVQPAVSR